MLTAYSTKRGACKSSLPHPNNALLKVLFLFVFKLIIKSQILNLYFMRMYYQYADAKLLSNNRNLKHYLTILILFDMSTVK